MHDTAPHFIQPLLKTPFHERARALLEALLNEDEDEG